MNYVQYIFPLITYRQGSYRKRHLLMLRHLDATESTVSLFYFLKVTVAEIAQ
jgi:hypothetical protein